jgi:hypothetical protein
VRSCWLLLRCELEAGFPFSSCFCARNRVVGLCIRILSMKSFSKKLTHEIEKRKHNNEGDDNDAR